MNNNNSVSINKIALSNQINPNLSNNKIKICLQLINNIIEVYRNNYLINIIFKNNNLSNKNYNLLKNNLSKIFLSKYFNKKIINNKFEINNNDILNILNKIFGMFDEKILNCIKFYEYKNNVINEKYILELNLENCFTIKDCINKTINKDSNNLNIIYNENKLEYLFINVINNNIITLNNEIELNNYKFELIGFIDNNDNYIYIYNYPNDISINYYLCLNNKFEKKNKEDIGIKDIEILLYKKIQNSQVKSVNINLLKLNKNNIQIEDNIFKNLYNKLEELEEININDDDLIQQISEKNILGDFTRDLYKKLNEKFNNRNNIIKCGNYDILIEINNKKYLNPHLFNIIINGKLNNKISGNNNLEEYYKGIID